MKSLFVLLCVLVNQGFGQVLLVASQPTPHLAPQCICTPGQPCPCGKGCQCTPAKPAPKVSVMKQPQCVNGQCFPQIAPKAIGQKQNTPGAPLAKANVHQGPVSFICENGVCRPVQAPTPKPAGSERPASHVTGGGACSSCSGVRYSQPVRRFFRRW